MTIQFRGLDNKPLMMTVKGAPTVKLSSRAAAASTMTGTTLALIAWCRPTASWASSDASGCEESCEDQMAVRLKLVVSTAMSCTGREGYVPAAKPSAVYPTVAEVTPGIAVYSAVSSRSEKWSVLWEISPLKSAPTS